MIIRTSHPGELGAIVEMLDEAFIYSKGRRISLATRFPGLFVAENSDGIYLGIENGKPAVIVATRRFKYRLRSELLTGVMVGGVFTVSEFRREGRAAAVMTYMQKEMLQGGADFGILWASDPRLYQRLGWECLDSGRYTSFDVETASRGKQAGRGCPRFDVAAEKSWIPEVDGFRRDVCEQGWLGAIERTDASYAAVPIPAFRVKVLVAKDGNSLTGYCICGEAEHGQAYVYEAHGSVPLGRSLIRCLSEDLGARAILINDREGNLFYDDLTELTWSNQNLTMLFKVRDSVQLGDVFVPYIDRI